MFYYSSPEEVAFALAFFVILSACLAAFAWRMIGWCGLLICHAFRPPCPAKQYRKARARLRRKLARQA